MNIEPVIPKAKTACQCPRPHQNMKVLSPDIQSNADISANGDQEDRNCHENI